MPRARHLAARRSALPLAALVTAVAVGAGTLLGGGVANAATVTANPLAGAAGFTVVSFSDVELSNHEIEGSIAAAGSATTTSSSPYNVIHAAAGNAQYTLPQYAGMPVRLVLGGGFDVAGATNMIRVSSSGLVDASTQAGRIVIGDSTGVSVGGRGSGVCVQESGRNDCGGPVIEQSNHVQTPSSAVDPDAFDTLIPTQAIADLTEASAQISAGDLVGAVTTPALSGSGPEYELTLTADAVNVWNVDPATLPVGNWKLRFGSVAPSASTPLIIRVQAADNETVNLPMETIGAYSAPGSSTDNAYARYMLWNIEQPAGSTVNLVGDGIIPGSFLAPNSHLVTPDHSSKTLIEGQIVARQVTFRHAGEVHHYSFTPELEFTTTPTSATGGFQLAKAFSGTGATTAVEAATYQVEYFINGATTGTTVTLNGDGTPATITGLTPGDTITFTELTPPTVADVTWGTATFSPTTLTIGAGTTPLVTLTNAYTHTPTSALSPRITSQAYVGDSVTGTANGQVSTANRLVTDVVFYNDLTPETNYRLMGELVYIEAGDIVSTGITNSVLFTTAAASTSGLDGSVDSPFTLSASDVERFAGRTLYIFQTLIAVSDDSLVAFDGAVSAADPWFSTTREWFTIAATPAPGGGTDDTDATAALPTTGAEVAIWVLLAAAMLMLGLWAVLASRRTARHRA